MSDNFYDKNIFKKYPSTGKKLGGMPMPDVFFKKSKSSFLVPQGTILIRIYNPDLDKKSLTAVGEDGETYLYELGPKGSNAGEQIMTESEFESIKSMTGGGDKAAGLKKMMASGFKFERLEVKE